MKKKASAKKVSGKKYVKKLEIYEDKKQMRSDNHPASKPEDIADAISRAKKQQGYSKKPRLKAQSVKGKSARGR